MVGGAHLVDVVDDRAGDLVGPVLLGAGTGAVPLRAAGAAAVGAAGGPAVAVASEPLLSLMARSLGRSTVRRRPSWPLAQSRLQVAAS